MTSFLRLLLVVSCLLGARAQLWQERYGDCPIDWGAFAPEYEYLSHLDRQYFEALYSGYEAYLATVEGRTSVGLGLTFGVDAVRSYYNGDDTATQAAHDLLRHGFANGFFEFLEDEDGQPTAYQQS